MVLMSSAVWNKLHRAGESGCPQLFYAFTKDSSGLILRLTDLVAIWQCSLDIVGITEAAKEQHSSIDPSESSAQLRVLLDKLEQSLESRDNHLSKHKDEITQTVYLTTKLRLPKPLKPLSWTFELTKRGSGELAEQLLRPCLHEASIAKQKLESLFRVIKDKDHVLMRLLEKVDSLGTDLSLVFPGITSLKSRKGRVTAQEAQKHVAGMAEFDHERWAHGFDQDSPYAGFHDKSMNSLVAGCEKCPKHTVQQHDDWMDELPVHGRKQSNDGPEVKRPMKRKISEKSLTDDSQNEFETQATPPHLRKGGDPNETLDINIKEPRRVKKPKLGRVGGPGNSNGLTQRSQYSKDSSGSEPETQSMSKAVRTETGVSDKSAAEVDSESDTETASEAESKNLTSQPKPSQNARGNEPRKLGRLASHCSERHSSSQSRSATPSQPATNQRGTPKKQVASRTEFNIQSRSPSPTRHTTRTGNSLDRKASQRHDSIPENHIGTSTAPIKSPPRPIPSRSASASVSTSNPNTPRKLGRLKQPLLSRSDTASEAEPSTPSKSHHPKNDINPRTSPSLSKKPRVHESDASTETDSDSDLNTKMKSKAPTTNRPPSQKQDNTTPSPSPSPSPNSDSGSDTGTARKTTTLNHESQAGPRSKRKQSSSPIPAPPNPPAVRETAEEAANRRRNDLKQKLNVAGGAGRKKKRKF